MVLHAKTSTKFRNKQGRNTISFSYFLSLLREESQNLRLVRIPLDAQPPQRNMVVNLIA